MAMLLKNKKVLVVGASGFIGRNLVEELIREKAVVSILIRKKSDLKLFSSTNVKCYIGDLLNYSSLSKATKSIDIVFNASGALPYHNLQDSGYWGVNVTGVENLIKASIKSRVKRFIHLSTVGIYGDIARNVSEKTQTNPDGVYSTSKLAGEKIIGKYKNKIETVIIRPTLAYGPMDTRPVFFRLFKLIKKGIFFPIGKGDNYFHTLYVGNLIDALILSATKKGAIGEDFIIGDEPCPKFFDLEKEIFLIMGKKIPGFYIPKQLALVILGFFGKSGQVSFITDEKKYRIDKAKKKLGYKPSVSLKKGLKKTFDWYVEQNLL